MAHALNEVSWKRFWIDLTTLASSQTAGDQSLGTKMVIYVTQTLIAYLQGWVGVESPDDESALDMCTGHTTPATISGGRGSGPGVSVCYAGAWAIPGSVAGYNFWGKSHITVLVRD